MSACSLNANITENLNDKVQSSNFANGKFYNDKRTPGFEWGKTWKILKRYITEPQVNTEPSAVIPVTPMLTEDLLSTEQDSVWRLGHSSMLLKISNEFVLLDPMFSERASPFSMMGPKRFHQPPISIHQLPHIKAVVISHNHYDHLDKASIQQLADRVDQFIVPLGNGADLISWGIHPEKIKELDWWQQTEINDITITATPSQHFSGRGLGDGNKTLWASYVINSPQTKIFFTGDSGYFNGFKEIGKRFGPFDLTLIETGAYDKMWSDVHMQPKESLQTHLDVKGKKMLPVHNGTFNLAFHEWTDPFDQISQLAQEKDVDLLTPKMGDRVTIHDKNQTLAWWQPLKN